MAKKRSKIGFNPLAWMKTGADDAPVAAPVPAAPVAKVETMPRVETVPKKEPPASSAPSTPTEIELDGGEALDLANAARLHAEFKQALSRKKPLRLGLSRVQAVDTAGMQLLLALRRDAKKNGVTALWEKPTRELCIAASQLGLSAALGLPPPEGAR